jgi:hypothetical protein
MAQLSLFLYWGKPKKKKKFANFKTPKMIPNHDFFTGRFKKGIKKGKGQAEKFA